LDSKQSYPFPNSVFPIFSGLLNSCAFQSSGTPFDPFLERMISQITSSPLQPKCTREIRFITFLVLYVLVSTFGKPFELDQVRIQKFLEAFKPVVDSAFEDFAQKIIDEVMQKLL